MYSTASPIDQRLTVNINVPKSVPLITTLLRASRNQDEELIKNVLHHIVTEGISVDDLNATDASGRVSDINCFMCKFGMFCLAYDTMIYYY